MSSGVLVENINLFDLINGVFIIGSQQINLYISNIEEFNTPYPIDIEQFVSNSYGSGDVITKTPESIDIQWGPNTASHGIVYPEVLSIDASTKYLMVSYKSSGTVRPYPFVRDGSNNLIYWICGPTKSRLLYKKIECDPSDPTGQILSHTYLIAIPDDPAVPVEEFKLYLLGKNIVEGETTRITDIKLTKVSSLPKITINISI